MKKRVLCFLTAAVLALLPWAAPAEDGDDEECRHEHKDTVRYVAPAVGVPGYSGDYACLDCGFVFQKGDVIPAVDDPVGAVMAGGQDDSGGNDTDGLTEPAVIPAVSDPEPDPPPQPDSPAQPEMPAAAPAVQAETQPETKPELPVEAPAVQAETQPETKPEAPAQPAAVSAPEAETAPEVPAVPDPPKAAAEPVPEANPDPVPEPVPAGAAPAAASDPAPRQPSGGSGGTRPSGRTPFSEKYPFRRVKMNPEPGIRAEAAGTLLWPKAVSPLQQMAGD